VSGNWYPLGDGVLHDVAQFLPSYWLVRASHVALDGAAWSVTGWLVVLAWALLFAVLARMAFRRDTERV
jgi:ABC-type multidrug transport system permease subunit